MGRSARKARRRRQAAQVRELRRREANPKAKHRDVGLSKRRSISWCYAHDSHVSGDSGRCEAAEGQLPPWEWDGSEAECVVGRALLELPEVPK